MNYMKKLFLLSVMALSVIILILSSCEEETGRGPISTDGVAPAAISEVAAIPLPGGAKIRYQLPNDTDLLGVKVNYTLPSGEPASVSASLYVNEIDVL